VLISFETDGETPCHKPPLTCSSSDGRENERGRRFQRRGAASTSKCNEFCRYKSCRRGGRLAVVPQEGSNLSDAAHLLQLGTYQSRTSASLNVYGAHPVETSLGTVCRARFATRRRYPGISTGSSRLWGHWGGLKEQANSSARF
jgi:hypothetical protein